MNKNTDEIIEGHGPIPKGYLILFFGLAIWGLWYIVSYTPGLSGWSQRQVYDERMKAEQSMKREVPFENPYERDPKTVAEGRQLYAASCTACHGADLKGGVGTDLTGHFVYGETDRDKYLSISEGRPGGMPPFGDQLGRDRIWKVLAYMDSVREYGKTP